MDFHVFLLLAHLIGTILGVGGATFIEINLNTALKDGKMDDTDKLFLHKSFFITRLGTIIAIVSGLGFIIEYWMNNQLFRLVDGVFWAKMIIIVLINVNAWMLAKRKIGLYWGSALSFIGWWVAFVLGFFLTNGIKFFPADMWLSMVSILAVYAVTVVAGAWILHKFRPTPPPKPPVQPSAPTSVT